MCLRESKFAFQFHGLLPALVSYYQEKEESHTYKIRFHPISMSTLSLFDSWVTDTSGKVSFSEQAKVSFTEQRKVSFSEQGKVHYAVLWIRDS